MFRESIAQILPKKAAPDTPAKPAAKPRNLFSLFSFFSSYFFSSYFFSFLFSFLIFSHSKHLLLTTAPPKPPSSKTAPAAPSMMTSSTPGTTLIGKVTADEVMQRGRLLAGNRDLQALHASLVKGGVVSEEEFWETRKVQTTTFFFFFF